MRDDLYSLVIPTSLSCRRNRPDSPLGPAISQSKSIGSGPCSAGMRFASARAEGRGTPAMSRVMSMEKRIEGLQD
jgi:hypothetical protein